MVSSFAVLIISQVSYDSRRESEPCSRSRGVRTITNGIYDRDILVGNLVGESHTDPAIFFVDVASDIRVLEFNKSINHNVTNS